jgi:hypothetical protein
MVASLKSLLDRVIDYAGLFPPAELEMPRAVSEFLVTSKGPDAWILSRFACPSARLTEFGDELRTRPGLADTPVSVIGTASQDLDGWHAALEQDAKLMNDFVEQVGESAAIEAYEVRIPANKDIVRCIKDLKAFEEVDVFVELPWGAGIDDSLAALAETEWLCAKARTGGQSPESFPPALELAGFLHGAIALELSFKLTAGLHHPLPRVDRATGARIHGFINVLAASAFAYVEDMSRNEIADVLLTASLEEWRFEEKRLSWRDSSITLEDIEDVREMFWSIGSCSVEVALSDLDALGLIAGGR